MSIRRYKKKKNEIKNSLKADHGDDDQGNDDHQAGRGRAHNEGQLVLDRLLRVTWWEEKHKHEMKQCIS